MDREDDEHVSLPVTPVDEDFGAVRTVLCPSAEDQLVLQVFADASEDSDLSSFQYNWDGSPVFSWSDDGPSPLVDTSEAMIAYAKKNKVTFASGSTATCTGKLTHLHPGKWFVAFSEHDMQNHL